MKIIMKIKWKNNEMKWIIKKMIMIIMKWICNENE